MLLFVSVLRKIGAIALLVFFCAALGKKWHQYKDGFKISRIQLDFSCIRSDLRQNMGEDRVRKILSQNYSYLGRGRQCYAFASADGRYVLKFPRSDSYKLPFWLRACSFSFLDHERENCLRTKQKRLDWLVNSFHLAYRQLKEETSLIYLHLDSTKSLNTCVSLKDDLGRGYQLDLNNTVFVLQEKKPLMVPFFRNCLERGDREAAQAILESFMDLVANRAQKGISNKDGSFKRNFGYDGRKVIQLDIGDFYCPLEKNSSFSFQQTVGHVVEWLKEVDPEMQKWLQERLLLRAQELY